MAWRSAPFPPPGPRVHPALARVRAPGAILVSVARGLGRQAAWLRSWWARTPRERRGPALFLAAAAVLSVALLPRGPLLALLAVLAAAAWAGRERATADSGPGEAAAARLQCLYDALTPYFHDPDDPRPLYCRDGEWSSAFPSFDLDQQGRLTRLHLRYPAYFTDQEAAARARVEHVLYAKAGRGREYRFTWNEEDNHLLLTALTPLPTDITVQRFVTAPGETVLGFTDDASTRRTTPVVTAEGHVRHEPPVLWRTGPRSAEPHLLALGQPGSGATNLLRLVAVQALRHGDVLVVDGAGTGEFACLAGRPGVLAVESQPEGALAALEWAAHETGRRMAAMGRARQAGESPAPEARRPLWIVVDRPVALGHLAAAEGRPDPQELLAVPLRHGRATGVTVVVAETLDCARDLTPVLTAHTRARVALGPLSPDQIADVLGDRPSTTPAADVPPGRGYARLGVGPVLRLQVPYAPDPYDEEAGSEAGEAVLRALPPLPGRTVRGLRLHVLDRSRPRASAPSGNATPVGEPAAGAPLR